MGVWTQLREARPSFFLLRHPLSNRSPRSVLSLLSNEQGDIITLRGMEVLGAWRSLWRSAPRRFECSACLFCFLIERARRRQPTTENERGTDPFRAMSADAAVGVNTVVNYSEMNEVSGRFGFGSASFVRSRLREAGIFELRRAAALLCRAPLSLQPFVLCFFASTKCLRNPLSEMWNASERSSTGNRDRAQRAENPREDGKAGVSQGHCTDSKATA